MAPDFSAIADEIAAGIPPKFKGFLRRADPPIEMSWDYYAYCYQCAFDELAEAALRRDRLVGNLVLPLVSIGRHSIELALKASVQEYSDHTGIGAEDRQHHLVDIFDDLQEQFEQVFESDRTWSSHCRKIVKHIDDLDPRADRFRYPATRKGEIHQYTRVEIEGLIAAHKELTIFCDVTRTMLREMLGA